MYGRYWIKNDNNIYRDMLMLPALCFILFEVRSADGTTRKSNYLNADKHHSGKIITLKKGVISRNQKK